MLLNYSSQDFSDDNIKNQQFDWLRLATAYGVPMLRTVLLELRVRPGQTFMPQPPQLATELQKLNEERIAQLLKDHPYVCCDVEPHIHGMVVRYKDGERAMADCSCLVKWRDGHRALREEVGVRRVDAKAALRRIEN